MSKADDDNHIWDLYAKGVKQIGRLTKSVNALKIEKKPTPKTETHFHKATSALRPPVPDMKRGKPFQELLDRRTERQLKQGTFLIDARLDLHGMTQAEAYPALERFINAQLKTDKRHLLIITGKGKDGEGALRTNLAGWLETFPAASQILGLRPAAPRHGGGGAFYLILRRKKDEP